MNVDQTSISPFENISGTTSPGGNVRVEFRSSGADITPETAVLREVVADSTGRFEIQGPSTPPTYDGHHANLNWHVVSENHDVKIDVRSPDIFLEAAGPTKRNTTPWRFPIVSSVIFIVATVAMAVALVSDHEHAGFFATISGIAAFLAAVSAFFAFAARQSRRKFGAIEARVEIEPEYVRCFVASEKNDAQRMVATLYVVERSSRLPGADHPLEEREVILSEEKAELTLVDGVWSGLVERPRDLPTSFKARHVEIMWVVCFRLSASGMPDEKLNVGLIALPHPDARPPSAISIPRVAQ